MNLSALEPKLKIFRLEEWKGKSYGSWQEQSMAEEHLDDAE